MRQVVDRLRREADRLDDAGLFREAALAKDLRDLMQSGADQGDLYGPER